MPKLSDLINTEINKDTIKIQGVSIPVMFTMETFNYVQAGYGKSYPVFERDLNQMLTAAGGKVKVGNREMKIMYSLIYGMVKTAGTDCTMQEIRGGIPIQDLQDIFQTVLDIFQEQDFQQKDIKKFRQSKEKKS